jgi:hypothetical protein
MNFALVARLTMCNGYVTDGKSAPGPSSPVAGQLPDSSG